MKKFLLTTLALVAFVLSGIAQVPQAVNYQAVARDASGTILPNRNISVKITINNGAEEEVRTNN